MLNVSTVEREVHTETRLVVGVDVSKDKLDLYADHTDPAESRRQELDGEVPNRSGEIESVLQELAGYAEEKDLEGLLVICEPTGGYEDQLLKTARRLGHETAYANGEHVSKASTIESGDPGKTDSMDARVIAMIGEMDKTQKERVLEGEHALLRELGRMYEAFGQAVVRAQCRLHDLLRKLFCDLEKGKRFVFSNTGGAVAEIYGWNPQKIVDDGRERCPSAEREVLEQRVRQLWADYTRHEERKEEIAEQMGELFKQLNRKGKAPDRVGGLDAAMMARLLAESGSLSDFDHWREVLHYCGLNLYERESGTYKGETKISKKGRSRFRKVLGQAAFALVQGDGPFAAYFERKRNEGMNYWKTMVATMRKLCKVLYGLAKSGEVYDPARVSACESQYASARS